MHPGMHSWRLGEGSAALAPPASRYAVQQASSLHKCTCLLQWTPVPPALPPSSSQAASTCPAPAASATTSSGDTHQRTRGLAASASPPPPPLDELPTGTWSDWYGPQAGPTTYGGICPCLTVLQVRVACAAGGAAGGSSQATPVRCWRGSRAFNGAATCFSSHHHS